MAHFDYTKPGGDWTNGTDTIDATDLEDFEQKSFKAVNGDEGGTWTPSSPINLLGSGVQLGPLRLTSAKSYAADITALKAITGMADGHVVYVKRKGLYFYEDPDSTAEAQPWIVAPTSGTGRWFHSAYSLLNASSGLGALDSSAKLPLPNTRGALVASSVVQLASSHSVGSSYVALYTATTGALVAGDVIVADAYGHSVHSAAGASTYFARFNFAGGAQTGPESEQDWELATYLAPPWHLSDLYVVPSDGTVTIAVEDKKTAGTVGSQIHQLRYLVFRP